MKFLCLCPVYNHPQRLLENSLSCFLSQTHHEALLLIGDDGIGYQEGFLNHRVLVHRFPERQPSLGHKYQAMLEVAIARGIEFDAVAIWEDDDIYFTDHLEQHRIQFEENQTDWNYYHLAGSTYGGRFHLEASGGRFWAGITVRRSYLEKQGGFVQTKEASFDQQFIQRMMAGNGKVGFTPPTYVYRWDDTLANHTSGFMSSPTDHSWYEKTPVAPSPGGRLLPQFDKATESLWYSYPACIQTCPVWK